MATIVGTDGLSILYNDNAGYVKSLKGPAGIADATSLLGKPLGSSVANPQDNALLGYEIETGSWVAYNNVDCGTF